MKYLNPCFPRPHPAHPQGGPILQTNVSRSGAYPMPAAQTTRLQTSLLPSLAGQCRHALTVSVETQVLHAPGPTSNFRWGEKGTKRRRFVKQHKPRRERKPVRSHAGFSVWVLSCSEGVSACLTATRVCRTCHRGMRWLARTGTGPELTTWVPATQADTAGPGELPFPTCSGL